MAKLSPNPRRVKQTEHALSPAEVDNLANEAESGYDLSVARRRRLGRPSLGPGASPKVSFRTSRTLYEAARDRAAREGRSISELARRAIEQYVAGSGS